MEQKEIAYSIVDVFTDTRFRGNPLAVIHDGQALSSEEMQSITPRVWIFRNLFHIAAVKCGINGTGENFLPLAKKYPSLDIPILVQHILSQPNRLPQAGMAQMNLTLMS